MLGATHSGIVTQKVGQEVQAGMGPREEGLHGGSGESHQQHGVVRGACAQAAGRDQDVRAWPQGFGRDPLAHRLALAAIAPFVARHVLW